MVQRQNPPKKAKRKPCKLTPLQENFANNWIIDQNAEQAMRRAGGQGENGRIYGKQCLDNPDVKEYIKAKQSALGKKFDVTQERVLLELARMAFFDPRSLYHQDGRPKLPHEMTADEAAAIVSWDLMLGDGNAPGILKVKFADKLAALASIAKMLGYNAPEKVQLDIGPDMIDRLKRGRLRALGNGDN